MSELCRAEQRVCACVSESRERAEQYIERVCQSRAERECFRVVQCRAEQRVCVCMRAERAPCRETAEQSRECVRAVQSRERVCQSSAEQSRECVRES